MRLTAFALLSMIHSLSAYSRHPFNHCPEVPRDCEECNRIEQLSSDVQGLANGLTRWTGSMVSSVGITALGNRCFSRDGHGENGGIRQVVADYLRNQQREIQIWMDCANIPETCQGEACSLRRCTTAHYERFLASKSFINQNWQPMREATARGFGFENGSVYDVAIPRAGWGGGNIRHPHEGSGMDPLDRLMRETGMSARVADLPERSESETAQLISNTIDQYYEMAVSQCPDQANGLDYADWRSRYGSIRVSAVQIPQYRCTTILPPTRTQLFTDRPVGWRCPSQPETTYVREEGNPNRAPVFTFPLVDTVRENPQVFTACLARRQIENYRRNGPMPRTLGQFQTALQAIFPRRDMQPGMSNLQKFHRSRGGVELIARNVFGQTYVGGNLNRLREAQRDRYFAIVGQNPLMVYIETGNPTNAQMGQALERIRLNIENQLSLITSPPRCTPGPMGMASCDMPIEYWNYLLYSGVVNEWLRENQECCQFVVDGWNARDWATGGRHAQYAIAAAAAGVGAALVCGPAALVCSSAAVTAVLALDARESGVQLRRTGEATMSAFDPADPQSRRDFRRLDGDQQDYSVSTASTAAAPVVDGAVLVIGTATRSLRAPVTRVLASQAELTDDARAAIAAREAARGPRRAPVPPVEELTPAMIGNDETMVRLVQEATENAQGRALFTGFEREPVVAWRVPQDFRGSEDLPAAIRALIGGEDSITYSEAYLRSLRGNAIALQRRGDGVWDIYPIGDDAMARYRHVEPSEGQLGPAIRLLGSADGLIVLQRPGTTQMVRASQLGIAVDQPFVYTAMFDNVPTQQVKPAGEDAFIVQSTNEAGQVSYYMVNADETLRLADGSAPPLGYRTPGQANQPLSRNPVVAIEPTMTYQLDGLVEERLARLLDQPGPGGAPSLGRLIQINEPGFFRNIANTPELQSALRAELSDGEVAVLFRNYLAADPPPTLRLTQADGRTVVMRNNEPVLLTRGTPEYDQQWLRTRRARGDDLRAALGARRGPDGRPIECPLPRAAM